MSEDFEQLKEETLSTLSGEKKSDQEIAREEKLKELAKEGIDIFPHRAKKTHSVFEIVSKYASFTPEELEKYKVKVNVPGRIVSIRRMGRATFFHITDTRARLQAYLREERIGKKNYRLFSLIDIGDIVAVEGVLFKTKTGELTVLGDSFTFLAKCLHPLPEKWHGLQDVELRYRKRYLDLIINPEIADLFRLRSSMILLIRKFFERKGYVEVETPMMQPIPGGALARPFKTYHNALGMELYLRIAPELYLKRMVVGGFEKVYEINRNFRNEGISSEHNPEFTMLEFYQAYSDYHDMMGLTEELICYLTRRLFGKEEIVYQGEKILFKRPWKRIKFKDALLRYSGLSPSKFEDKGGIIELASTLTPEKKALTYGKALDIIFDKYVREKLIEPTFIVNLPKEVSPLAKTSRENPEEAERFELVLGGIEVANGYSELTDPVEQKLIFEQQKEEREKGSEEAHWVDMDYIHALEYGLPPTGGCGIGIDRLAMVLTNRKSIREVILFPLLRPKS